jgi:hypothetical protein
MILTSIIIGIIAGYLYGLWYLTQVAKAPTSFLISFARMCSFGVGFSYVLRSGLVHLILFLATYMLTFWIQIIRYRTGKHGTYKGSDV